MPTTLSARQVSDTLDVNFPPNRTSPIEVVVGSAAASPQIRALAARMRALPGVATVAPPQPAGADLSLLVRRHAARPAERRRSTLVHRIRAMHAPVYVGVAGQTASFVDLEHSLAAHIPSCCAVIVHDARRPVPDDGLGRAATEGRRDECARAERDVRDPRVGVPGRAPAGAAVVQEPRRARRDPADIPGRCRLRARDRLRRVPALADQRSARDSGAPTPTRSRSGSSAPDGS